MTTTTQVTLTKAAQATLEATADETAGADLAEGQFTALVSVFGNVDTYGDVVMPGAFATSLAEAGPDNPIPVIWAHRWDDPMAHIGYVVHAEETADGLRITGQLDLDTENGSQVYRLLRARRIRQFSFAFDIRPGGARWATRIDPETGEKQDVFELHDLVLHEVGPCLIGVNRETQLEAVKASRAPYTQATPTAGDDAAAASQPETEQDGQDTKAADGYLADPASIELELSILNDTETL